MSDQVGNQNVGFLMTGLIFVLYKLYFNLKSFGIILNQLRITENSTTFSFRAFLPITSQILALEGCNYSHVSRSVNLKLIV